MILLVLVVLLWVGVLAPSAWRRLREHQGVGSIDSFHHELQLLEHASPKTVTPAYRLHTAVPGRGGGADTPAVDPSRPKLVLVRRTADQWATDVDGSDGCHYERVGVLDRPEPVCLPDTTADLSVYRRDQARRRCTMLLRCLVGVAISTGLIGMFPGMHLAWIFTALSGVAALALVGLIGYARELEAQQRSRRTRAARAEIAAQGVDPASAGYPGAWDEDDFEVPHAVAH